MTTLNFTQLYRSFSAHRVRGDGGRLLEDRIASIRAMASASIHSIPCSQLSELLITPSNFAEPQEVEDFLAIAPRIIECTLRYYLRAPFCQSLQQGRECEHCDPGQWFHVIAEVMDLHMSQIECEGIRSAINEVLQALLTCDYDARDYPNASDLMADSLTVVPEPCLLIQTWNESLGAGASTQLAEFVLDAYPDLWQYRCVGMDTGRGAVQGTKRGKVVAEWLVYGDVKPILERAFFDATTPYQQKVLSEGVAALDTLSDSQG